MLNLAIEAYAMMGDYLEFSLRKAGEKDFQTIHLSGMWAKIMKAAMHIPQTHVRNGALEVADGAAMLAQCGAKQPLLGKLEGSNTAREMLGHLEEAGRDDIVHQVCLRARDYARQVSGKEVRVYLINAQAKVIEHV
jgi:cobalt-precorrin-5B (C1)-methyltransferase